jgi:hypothetical protein
MLTGRTGLTISLPITIARRRQLLSLSRRAFVARALHLLTQTRLLFSMRGNPPAGPLLMQLLVQGDKSQW